MQPILRLSNAAEGRPRSAKPRWKSSRSTACWSKPAAFSIPTKGELRVLPQQRLFSGNYNFDGSIPVSVTNGGGSSDSSGPGCGAYIFGLFIAVVVDPTIVFPWLLLIWIPLLILFLVWLFKR